MCLEESNLTGAVEAYLFMSVPTMVEFSPNSSVHDCSTFLFACCAGMSFLTPSLSGGCWETPLPNRRLVTEIPDTGLAMLNRVRLKLDIS